MTLVKLSDYAKHGLVALRDAGIGPPKPLVLPDLVVRTVQPKRGRMNKTEARYAERLDYRIAAGEVAWYGFEWIKLRLADGSWFTPDYFVVYATGSLGFDEVKGPHIREASIVRLKVAAETHWMFRFNLAQWKKGAWHVRSLDR